LLYWNIGKTIKEDIIKGKIAGYGEKLIEEQQKNYQINMVKGTLK